MYARRMAYTAPTVAELKALYPAFAAVTDSIVAAHIVRANRMVDATWTEGDYADAIMLLACHYMTLNGLGTGGEAQVNAQGLASFKVIKSGQLTLERGGASAGEAASVPVEWAGTTYGTQFFWLLRRNKPAVAIGGGTEVVPAGGWAPSLPYPAAWWAWPF